MSKNNQNNNIISQYYGGLQDLMDDVADWSDSQFGKGNRTVSMLHHLKKEVPELIEAVQAIQDINKLEDNQPVDFMECSEIAKEMFYEFADVFMLIIDSARSMNLNAKALIEFTQQKLEINKKRNWGDADENGVVGHTKDPDQVELLETI